MIVCGQCGERNEDGAQFCGACGEFLEWAGQPADRVHATTPPTAGPVATTPTGPVTTAPPPPPPPPFPPAPEPPTSVLPAPAPAGDPNAPGLHRPDEQVQRPRTPVNLPEQRRLPRPGEKICGYCGAGNEASRRFCNTCGHPMADAPVAEKLPWWRRFLRRVRRVFRRRVYNAGERRDVKQPIRWQRPTFILTLLALLIVALAVPPGRTLVSQAITAVQDRFGKRVEVIPVAGRATSAAAGHGAAMAFDGANNTYWAPAGNPLGAGITFDLSKPVRLLNIIITGGVSPDKPAFEAQGRPAEVDATITDKAGKKTTSTLTLQDQPGGQRFSVAVSNAVQLTLIIRSDYGVPPGTQVGIAEVELFARG
jgi:hypothetical protein